MSYPARAEGLCKYDKCTIIECFASNHRQALHSCRHHSVSFPSLQCYLDLHLLGKFRSTLFTFLSRSIPRSSVTWHIFLDLINLCHQTIFHSMRGTYILHPIRLFLHMHNLSVLCYQKVIDGSLKPYVPFPLLNHFHGDHFYIQRGSPIVSLFSHVWPRENPILRLRLVLVHWHRPFFFKLQMLPVLLVQWSIAITSIAYSIFFASYVPCKILDQQTQI